MKILLYDNRVHLPSYGIGGLPENSKEEFIPTRHGRRSVYLGCSGIIPLRVSWVWPILMGLWSIDLPVVAHVSIFLGADIKGKFKKWILKENLYLQITSPPPDTKSVYTYETGSLYLHEKYGSGNKSSSWKKFFVSRSKVILRIGVL